MTSAPSTTSPEYSSAFEHFDIELDAGKDAVFHGGELLTGFVKVKLKRPMTIEIIRLHFKGRGCFIERDGSKHEEKDKIYFDKDLTLLERPPGKPEPGHFPWIADFMYSLPFECTLPLGCPTSYENFSGFIRYFVRAIIEEANTKKQFVAKQCLNVVAPLSDYEDVPESNTVTDSEALTQGGCCCRTKISAEAQLQRSVYSPGEKVIGTLKISSKHQKKLLEMVEVKLVDRLGKMDGGKTRYAAYRSLYTRKLDPKEMQSSTLDLLKIPAVAPSLPGRSIEKVLPNDLMNKLVESPSTMTLRARKKPFLRIEYEIQICVGGKLTLHLPINVVLPGKDIKFTYQPFVAGAQYVDDSDERLMHKADDCGFSFSPLYPVAAEISEKPAPPIPAHVSVSEQNGIQQSETQVREVVHKTEQQVQEVQHSVEHIQPKQPVEVTEPEELIEIQPLQPELPFEELVVPETSLRPVETAFDTVPQIQVQKADEEEYVILKLAQEATGLEWQAREIAEYNDARQTVG